MDKVKFVEHFKFFKGCLPQILLSPFLNTLTYMLRYTSCQSCYLKKKVDANEIVIMKHFFRRCKVSSINQVKYT